MFGCAFVLFEFNFVCCNRLCVLLVVIGFVFLVCLVRFDFCVDLCNVFFVLCVWIVACRVSAWDFSCLLLFV